MSDFGDVEFFDNLEEMSSSGTPLAPDGEHNAQIIATDKYKSKAGNWTLLVTMQLDGGKYRDHKEWYNLWATSEENKRVSTEIFTRLTKAVGFKKYPENHGDFVGKKLVLKTEQIDDSFEGDNGVVNVKKTRIKLYLPEADSDMSPPKEAIPPF
jgi:hypothetical protein|tara:strand:+ start:822 stop:1283 length:462 start_codon:yes stop_codon:yes gene_type:complete